MNFSNENNIHIDYGYTMLCCLLFSDFSLTLISESLISVYCLFCSLSTVYCLLFAFCLFVFLRLHLLFIVLWFIVLANLLYHLLFVHRENKYNHTDYHGTFSMDNIYITNLKKRQCIKLQCELKYKMFVTITILLLKSACNTY